MAKKCISRFITHSAATAPGPGRSPPRASRWGQSAGGDEHVHAHRQGDVSDPRPDCAAASDEPDGLSVYLKVGQVTEAAPPHPVTQRQPLLLLHEGAAQVEHHGDGNVGHGLGAVRWKVAHSDALAPCRICLVKDGASTQNSRGPKL